MLRRPLVWRAGSGPSRLLVSVLLLLAVLAMHGLTMDHNVVVGAPSASMSVEHAPDSMLAVPVAAGSVRAVQKTLPVMVAVATLSGLMPGMTPMLGGMCLAVLLAAGTCVLVRRAGSAGWQSVWPSRGLPRRGLDLLPGHGPPGSLLLRICVMRT